MVDGMPLSTTDFPIMLESPPKRRIQKPYETTTTAGGLGDPRRAEKGARVPAGYRAREVAGRDEEPPETLGLAAARQREVPAVIMCADSRERCGLALYVHHVRH